MDSFWCNGYRCGQLSREKYSRLYCHKILIPKTNPGEALWLRGPYKVGESIREHSLGLFYYPTITPPLPSLPPLVPTSVISRTDLEATRISHAPSLGRQAFSTSSSLDSRASQVYRFFPPYAKYRRSHFHLTPNSRTFWCPKNLVEHWISSLLSGTGGNPLEGSHHHITHRW